MGQVFLCPGTGIRLFSEYEGMACLNADFLKAAAHSHIVAERTPI
jgi:hypothetical protein